MSARQAPASLRHEGVTITRDALTDRLVARKAAPPGAELGLRREVAVLRLLDGLAVCVPIDPRHDGSDGQIDLVYVGPRTLVDLEALRPDELLTALAGIARTLRAAHDRGVSHGRLTADHVLLDESGGPVLTGWSAAGIRTDVQPRLLQLGALGGNQHDGNPCAEGNPQAEGAAGPAGTDRPGNGHETETEPPFDPAADVAALGELAARAAQANRLFGGRVRTQLAAVAAAARHPDPSVRPPLSELVRVLELAGGSPDRPVDHPRHRRRSGQASRTLRVLEGPIGRLSLAAVGAAAAAALTVIVLDHLGSEPSAGPATAIPSAAPASMVGGGDSTVPDATAAITVAHRSGAPDREAPDAPASAPTGSDLRQPSTTPAECPTDADRLAGEGLPAHCAWSVVLDGDQIRVGSARYVLGSPGDQAGVGDPTCRGLLTPILWQHTSGRVYLFDGWATATATVTGRLAGFIADSTGLADPVGEACGPLLITRHDGTVAELRDPAGG